MHIKQGLVAGLYGFDRIAVRGYIGGVYFSRANWRGAHVEQLQSLLLVQQWRIGSRDAQTRFLEARLRDFNSPGPRISLGELTLAWMIQNRSLR